MVSVLSMVLPLGVARQQFRPGQVEVLQAAVEALHRLDRPRPLEVQAGLVVVGAVVGGDVPAELRQVDELGAIDGEQRQPGQEARGADQEDQRKLVAHRSPPLVSWHSFTDAAFGRHRRR